MDLYDDPGFLTFLDQLEAELAAWEREHTCKHGRLDDLACAMCGRPDLELQERPLTRYPDGTIC